MKKNQKPAKYGKVTNQRCKCIPPDYVEIGMKYAFSFNPIQQPPNTYSETLTQYNEWNKLQHKFFSELKYCKFALYLDMSSLGRLHYHGYIIINDICNFFFKDIPNIGKHGSYEIDFIKDHVIWETYVMKSKTKMSIDKWCESKGITYSYVTLENKLYRPAEVQKIIYDEQFNFFDDIDDRDIDEII